MLLLSTPSHLPSNSRIPAVVLWKDGFCPSQLTTDRLSEPGAPEQIVYYHIIPEYQTEESMYNAVRRFGKVSYDTLRLPMKVTAEEADGSVRFGSGDGSAAYLFDPDIYTDGRISVQGIDGVLFPKEEVEAKKEVRPAAKIVTKARRDILMVIGAVAVGYASCLVQQGLGRSFFLKFPIYRHPKHNT